MQTKLIYRRGSISLFAAAILVPFIFFLFSLALDISRYYQMEEQAQHALDNAALAAGHHLPFTASARRAVQEMLPPGLREHTSTSITPESIDLRFSSSVDGVFSRFFGSRVSPQVFAHSKTESIPIQALLLLDSSDNVATKDGSPVVDTESIGLLPFEISRCFNSRFTPLKKAVIGLYEYLVSNSSNAIGVGFFPGHFGVNPRTGTIEGDNDLDIIREPLTPVAMRNTGITNQVRFRPYGSASAKDVWCAAIGQSSSTHEGLRTPRSKLSSTPNSDALVVPSDLNSGWEINLPRENEFQVREVLWAKAASGQVALDTVAAISKGLSLVIERASDGTPTKIPSRKILIVAASTTPVRGSLTMDSTDLQASLASEIRSKVAASARGLEIWYVLLGDTTRAPLLKTLFDQIHQENDHFRGHVFASSSAIDLEQNKIPEISRLSKQMVLLR